MCLAYTYNNFLFKVEDCLLIPVAWLLQYMKSEADHLEMVESQMVETVGAGGKGLGAEGAAGHLTGLK